VTSRTYGAANPVLAGSITGLAAGDTLATALTGTATYSTLATNTSNVGNYGINGSGLTAMNGNYVLAQAAANSSAFRITPATLTYTATSSSRVYGAANPAFGGGVSGFVLGQNLASATTGTLIFTTSATTTTNVGNYAISGSGLTANSGNYVFAQAKGNSTALAITPATLTVSAKNTSKIFGTNQSFAGNEFTTAGIVGSDAVSTVALYSPGSGISAAEGAYPITASNALFRVGSAANYRINYVAGRLTVDPVPPMPSIPAEVLPQVLIPVVQNQSPIVVKPVEQSSPQMSMADAVNLALETSPAGAGYEDESDSDGHGSHSDRHESEDKGRTEKKKVFVAGATQSMSKAVTAKSLPVCR
jgi:hypothetical protein